MTSAEGMTREEAESILLNSLTSMLVELSGVQDRDRVRCAEVLADYLARTQPAPSADLGGQRAVRVDMPYAEYRRRHGLDVEHTESTDPPRSASDLRRARRVTAEKWLDQAGPDITDRARHWTAAAIAAAMDVE